MGKALDGTNLGKGLVQRKDGTYMARCQVDGRGATLYNRNLQELKRQLEETRVDMRRGNYTQKTKLTFEEAYQEWIDTKRMKDKQTTIDSYEQLYKKHMRKQLGNLRISSVKHEDLQGILNTLAQENYSNGLVVSAYTIGHGVMELMVQTRRLQENPFRFVQVPRTKARQHGEAFTISQQKRFLEYCKENHYGDILEFLLLTGLRAGECLAIRYKDVDFKNQLLHVNYTLVRCQEEPHWRLQSPKSATSKRTIPLVPRAVEILKKWRDSRSIVSFSGDDYVFHRAFSNEPILYYTLNYQFQQIHETMVKAGEMPKEQKCTVHCLRHTFATRFVEAGGDITVLQHLLGHSSLAMTSDLYSHCLLERKQDEVKKVASALQLQSAAI